MKTKTFLLIIIQLIFMSCQTRNYKKNSGLLIDDIATSLRKDLLSQYENNEKLTLAVAGFSRIDLLTAKSKYKSVTPKLGIMIANALQNEMFKPAKFDLIERFQVDALLSELDFNQLGITENNGIPSLKIKGIKAIVLGSVQLRDRSFRFDARIVEVETGKVLSVASKVVDYYDFLNDAYNEYPKNREACHATIQAHGEWQSTGCVIKNISRLHVKATGSWSMTNNGYSFGPEGVEDNPSTNGDYRMMAVNHGALICRIGDRSMYYDGVKPLDIRGLEGVLECRINDSDVYNNRGSVKMTIELEE